MNSALRNEHKTIELAPGIIPDWHLPNEVIVVWPERLRAGVGKLKKFYKHYIDLLRKHTRVHIICYPDINPDLILSSFDDDTDISVTPLHVSDICIHNHMPFAQRPKDGRSVLKPLYSPSYLNERSDAYSVDANNSAILLSEQLGYKVDIPQNEFGMPLILDASNIIFNGRDTAICSNRVISDNESWSLDQLKDVFFSRFGVSNLIFIPVIPQVTTGAIDTFIRFINEQNVVIADPKEGYLKDFLQKISVLLNRNEIEVHHIPSFNSQASVLSGNFVNFFRLGNNIFLPHVYGTDAEMDLIRAVYNSLGLNVIPVPEADELCDAGKGMNSITWCAY